jgi:predicted Zn-dependent peptidase
MRWQAAAIEKLENPSAIGLAMARCVAVHENPDCLSPEMQSIESVTPQQIQAAIRTHLNRDRVLLSRVNTEQLSQELKDSEPLK